MQRTRLVNDGFSNSQFSQHSLGGGYRPFYSQSQPFSQPFPGSQMMMSPSFPLSFNSSQPQPSSVVGPPEMLGMYNFFSPPQQPLNPVVTTPSQMHTEQPLSNQPKSQAEPPRPPRRSQRAAAAKKKCAVEPKQCCGQVDGCGKDMPVVRNGNQRARGRQPKSTTVPAKRAAKVNPSSTEKRTRKAKNTTAEKKAATSAGGMIGGAPELFSQPVERIFAHPIGGPPVVDLACALAECRAVLERVLAGQQNMFAAQQNMLAAQQNILSRQHKLERHLGLHDIPPPAKAALAPTQNENISHGDVADMPAMDRENGREPSEGDSGSEYLDMEAGVSRVESGGAEAVGLSQGLTRNPLAEICPSNDSVEDEHLMSSLDDF